MPCQKVFKVVLLDIINKFGLYSKSQPLLCLCHMLLSPQPSHTCSLAVTLSSAGRAGLAGSRIFQAPFSVGFTLQVHLAWADVAHCDPRDSLPAARTHNAWIMYLLVVLGGQPRKTSIFLIELNSSY